MAAATTGNPASSTRSSRLFTPNGRVGEPKRKWSAATARTERKKEATPAMRLGLIRRRLEVEEVLAQRLFPTRIGLPEPWGDYYWRRVKTRAMPHCTEHKKRYAF